MGILCSVSIDYIICLVELNLIQCSLLRIALGCCAVCTWLPGFPSRSRHLFGFSTWRGKDARPERRCARVVMRTWPGVELTRVDMSWFSWWKQWDCYGLWLFSVSKCWKHLENSVIFPYHFTLRYTVCSRECGKASCTKRDTTLCTFRWISVLSKL